MLSGMPRSKKMVSFGGRVVSCLQNDFEDIASIEIQDFSEFLVNHVKVNKNKKKGGTK